MHYFNKLYHIKMYVILITLILGSITTIHAQPNIDYVVDSILNHPQQQSDTARVKLLISQGGKYRYNIKLEPVLKEGTKLAVQVGDKDLIVYAKYHLGNFYQINGQLDTALYILNNTVELAANTTDPFMLPSIYNTIGGTYIKMGSIQNGVESLLKAKKQYEKIDTSSLKPQEIPRKIGNLGVVANSLAIANQKIENYNEALNYYEESAAYFISLGNLNYAGAILSNKGDLLIKLQKYKEALEVLYKALRYKKEGKSVPKSLAMTELNIGVALLGLDSLLLANDKIFDAYQTFTAENDKAGMMYAAVEYGLTKQKLQQPNLAINYCEEGKSLAQINKDIEYKMKACKCLFDNYSTIKDHKQAADNLLVFTNLKDSLLNEENIKKLTQLEMQYEFDKERAISQIEQETKKSRNRIIIGALAILLLFATTTVVLIWQRARSNKKNAIVLKEKNNIITNALADKEVLLKEIHHRVKNNLQLISSLLRLQSKDVNDPAAVEALKEGRNRVKSMALIHQNLYQDESLVSVNMKLYIEKLCNNLFLNYKVNHKKVELLTDIDDVKFDINQIIPLGLILNELITNALKYAFKPDKKGQLSIELKEQRNNKVVLLTVKDNGIGMPKDFDVEKTNSLGFKLIRSFAQMLNAKYSVFNKNGTVVQLVISKT